jgi:plasmid maintenance system antidote protein VapI
VENAVRESAIAPDTALRLARFFGNSPEFWLNLQQMHHLSKARLELRKTIERDVKTYAGACSPDLEPCMIPRRSAIGASLA